MSKRVEEEVKTGDTELLRDLVRVKALFQLRALEAILRGPALPSPNRSTDSGGIEGGE